MAITGINNEDRLVQQTFAEHLEKVLGWTSVYAYDQETFGPSGTLGRNSEREAVLLRYLRTALARLNPDLPEESREEAVEKLTRIDASRSLIQHNQEYHDYIRNGVPVLWRKENGESQTVRAHVIDFRNPGNNDYIAVRELKVQGVRVPYYNRRGDLVCFVNGLPLVFIELKAVHRNIRSGFDDNLTDYMSDYSIQHAFHHNVFLVVSNGDKARYGSITSRWEHFVAWKRNEETDKARLDAVALLDGMLAKDRLLDIIESFVLFDGSRTGGIRKIVARNHQILGVNKAVQSVTRQEELKQQFPADSRLVAYTPPATDGETQTDALLPEPENAVAERESLPALFQRAHPDLGRLGVFWHTQGSGKSYSMAFFAEKVRRVVPGNFTFLVMTDREDLDDQIWRTFLGCGLTDENTPRASTGRELRTILQGNPRFVFSLIHKFNQTVTEPYSVRDDIIVISDEAHRTQAGKFARNMRLALPNASFIGFTGTPIFKNDNLTRRIFGADISRYDFQRAVDDRSTVRLVYENRGEKLGIARLDLNDRIADAVDRAELDPDQVALLERLLGKDYEVITADDRLDKLAVDFVDHCSTRWESGKSMLVCIDKVTCARMFQRIEPLWRAKIDELRSLELRKASDLANTTDPDETELLTVEVEQLRGRIAWMDSTIIEIIISEAQNEVRDFKKWGFDILPHRLTMKTGFQTPDGKRVNVEDAFKDPQHPFRIGIVCAMWLTGFDVECLSTLYIDKPMRAHNLMQAIARANRVYPGKDFGLIVDYNGMLKSLKSALAEYATGEDESGGTGDEGDGIAVPLEAQVAALVEAIELIEQHLGRVGFDVKRLQGAKGFDRIEALRDATNALYTTDETKRRFEIMTRQMFIRFKALLTEQSVYRYAERHDNIEAIYKKLQERRDTADVTEVLKELHRIVNEAIRTAAPGQDAVEGLQVDLSKINFEKLQKEFANKVKRKNSVLQDIREVVEKKLAQMLARNPMRMDFYKKYQEIIADYNREKDRTTVEETFAKLEALVIGLDAEQRRTVEEGLNDDELALFDLLFREKISKADRERLKQGSRTLLSSIRDLLRTMSGWTKKVYTQNQVRTLITDNVYTILPRPPFTEAETEQIAEEVFEYVWERSESGNDLVAA